MPLLNCAEARMSVPSINVMAPVALAGVTVALSVTSCPMVAGFGVAFNVTDVVEAPITSVTGAEVLAPCVASPPYAAVNRWLPWVRVEVLNAAVPPLSVAVLTVAAPSLKMIDPVALEGLTLALSTTV